MTNPQIDPAAASLGGARDDLAGDLAYVRSLAEEGAHAPLVSGRYLLAWGGLMGAASLFVYFTAAWLQAQGGMAFMAPWIVAGAAGWVLSFTVCRRAGVKPGAMTIGNQTAFSVWFAVGLFMTMMFAGLFVVHDNYIEDGVPGWFMFSMLFPISFGAYGVAFYAMATASRQRWLKYVALLAFGFSGVSLFFLTSLSQFLIGGFGALACAAIPGYLLMRREPSDVV